MEKTVEFPCKIILIPMCNQICEFVFLLLRARYPPLPGNCKSNPWGTSIPGWQSLLYKGSHYYRSLWKATCFCSTTRGFATSAPWTAPHDPILKSNQNEPPKSLSQTIYAEKHLNWEAVLSKHDVLYVQYGDPHLTHKHIHDTSIEAHRDIQSPIFWLYNAQQQSLIYTKQLKLPAL